jgi:hypothetical protein
MRIELISCFQSHNSFTVCNMVSEVTRYCIGNLYYLWWSFKQFGLVEASLSHRLFNHITAEEGGVDPHTAHHRITCFQNKVVCRNKTSSILARVGGFEPPTTLTHYRVGADWSRQ